MPPSVLKAVMRNMFVPVAVLVLTATSAHAAVSVGSATSPPGSASIAPAFGNTVLSLYSDGRSQKVWMHEDGSWDGLSRRGTELSGTWTIKANKVCVRQSRPPTLPLSYCIAFPADPHIGSTWPARDMTGTPIQLKLVKGKVTG
jgi:hypothetical protein